MNRPLSLLLACLLMATPVSAGVDLNGDADYITDGSGTLWDTVPSSGFISLWFITDIGSGGAPDYSLFTKINEEDAGGTRGFLTCFYDPDSDFSTNSIACRKNNAGTDVFTGSTTSLSTATWYHFIYAFGSGGVKHYINGTQDDSDANTNSWQNGTDRDFLIGSYNFGGSTSQYWNGKISEVYFFSHYPSAHEIATLASSKVKRIGCQFSPDKYLPLDNFSGGSALNTTANGYKDPCGSVSGSFTGVDSDGDSSNVSEQVLSYP